LVEENVRCALLLSDGDMMVFLQRPISAAVIVVSALMILAQRFIGLRRLRGPELRGCSHRRTVSWHQMAPHRPLARDRRGDAP